MIDLLPWLLVAGIVGWLLVDDLTPAVVDLKTRAWYVAGYLKGIHGWRGILLALWLKSGGALLYYRALDVVAWWIPRTARAFWQLLEPPENGHTGLTTAARLWGECLYAYALDLDDVIGLRYTTVIRWRARRAFQAWRDYVLCPESKGFALVAVTLSVAFWAHTLLGVDRATRLRARVGDEYATLELLLLLTWERRWHRRQRPSWADATHLMEYGAFVVRNRMLAAAEMTETTNDDLDLVLNAIEDVTPDQLGTYDLN